MGTSPTAVLERECWAPPQPAGCPPPPPQVWGARSSRGAVGMLPSLRPAALPFTCLPLQPPREAAAKAPEAGNPLCDLLAPFLGFPISSPQSPHLGPSQLAPPGACLAAAPFPFLPLAFTSPPPPHTHPTPRPCVKRVASRWRDPRLAAWGVCTDWGCAWVRDRGVGGTWGGTELGGTCGGCGLELRAHGGVSLGGSMG